MYCGYMLKMAKNLKQAKAFRFTDDEMKLLDALKAKHGTYNAGIIAAARTELGIDETDWPAALRRLAQILEDGDS